MTRSRRQLVVCGTDTDVGKTVVSALVVQGLGAHYWKPVQSGLEGGGDTGRLQALLQLPAERLLAEAYRLRAPVSPHWAAEREGIRIDPARLTLPAVTGPLVVETAGGLLVPLRRDWLQIDQLAVWGLPVLLVARSGLGTLNHTLLSVEALRRRGCICWAWCSTVRSTRTTQPPWPPWPRPRCWPSCRRWSPSAPKRWRANGRPSSWALTSARLWITSHN